MENQSEEKLDLRRGNAVKVFQKFVEGKKERIIAFQGKIIKSRGEGNSKMVTVRQFVDGVDVDRIFPLNAPSIIKLENIEIKKKKTRKKSVSKTSKMAKNTRVKAAKAAKAKTANKAKKA
ncbi:MAG: 50S ribosomal protein L19 [Candidatus Levybacteria bacterium]|nr:50S ribosomal protein L19 [Candidatus Levybacteria bacterium]